MTRTSLSALFITICFTGLVPGLCISLWQNPERIEWRGTDASITCHIKADSHVEEIMVKWLQDNRTVIMSKSFKEVSSRPSSVNGSVFINVTLNLLSIRLNHSGMYYCSAQVNIPVLEPTEYGNGTYVYVVLNSTTVTPTLTTNPYNMETLRWSVISGMGFALLIICIACVFIHIHFKGHCQIEPRAKEALVSEVASTRGSHCSDTRENVVYAAISMSSRNENCPASRHTSVTCTEESVTYSEVRIKKGPKEEGYCLAEFYSQ